MTAKKESELQDRINLLEKAIQETQVLSIAYLPSGQLLTAVLDSNRGAESLQAAKLALQQALARVDNILLEAVAREAAAIAENA